MTVHKFIDEQGQWIRRDYLDDNFAAINQQIIVVTDPAYGAVGDFNGVTGTDNYVAIQKAIDALFKIGGGVLWFPKGFYRISQPLNLTGNATAGRFGNTPITFRGPGIPNAFDTGSWSTYGGAWIIGQTGGWVIDATGMQYFAMQGVGVRGTGPGASKGGVLAARSTLITFAHDHQYQNCVIWVDTAPAYTAIGSIAFANNGAENFLMDQCWLIADSPLSLTWRNVDDLNLASSYVTVNSAAPYNSTTMLNFRNTAFQALTGYATNIYGACNGFFDTCIWAAVAGNLTNQAIRLLSGQAGAAHCQDLRFTGQVEGFPSAARFDDAQMWNIDMDLMMPGPTAAYLSSGGGVVNNLKLNVHHLFGSTGQSVINASAALVLNGGEINVYSGDTLTANTNVQTAGTIIKGHNVDVSGALGLNANSNYLALGTSGVTASPPIANAIVPNGANNALSDVSPNVANSYLSLDGWVRLSGNLVPNGATVIAAGTAAGTIAAAHRPDRECDAQVYIAGALFYARVLTNGQLIFGGPVNAAQAANINGISYKLKNT